MRKLLTGIVLLATTTLWADELGKKTYELACQNCHRPDLAKAIKAPAAFDKAAWDARFLAAAAKAKQNPKKYPDAMAYLLNSVQMGKGLMHHGGLCKEAPAAERDCSTEALTAAINYMSQR